MGVRVGLLGPLQLEIDGVDFAPSAPKERTLLALLAINHPHVVSVDRLSEELWPGLPADRARHALQVRIASLRKRFRSAGAASLLEHVSPGYRLALEADAIDVHRFAALVKRARSKSIDADATAAGALLRDALFLWRGEPLGDVQASPTLEGEAVRLRGAHLGAVEDGIEADLACGLHHALVSDLEALVMAQPLRERLWAQWILALYRCGRQAEALRACAAIRSRLVEELGVEPGPELRVLETAVLDQNPRLDWTAAVEVGWEPLGSSDAAVVPLPGRLGVSPAAGVVGRDTEMAVMLDVFKRVAGGEGREVLLVSGEAGLGKTTLVAQMARAAFERDACVLFGHCEEDLATPYQLFSEALGHFVTHAPEEELVAYVEGQGSELARLVPALSSRLPGLAPSKATDADTERYRLFAAVVGLLEKASRHQPVVIVLDDLQWADKASLQLLGHVLATGRPMQLLVLGTYRDTELSRSHPLLETLASLHRQQRVARIELSGLDTTDVMMLMEAAAGHPLDDGAVRLADAVHRETDGNPFFVSEVLRHLSETGAIYQNATGRWVVAGTLDHLALPDSVRVVIGARVGRLGRQAERVLSLAAVIGRDFDLDVLASASKTPEDEILDVLDAATTAALVQEVEDIPGHYRFAHALIQHTLYEDLGLTRRARAHRLLAETLEDLYGDRPGARVGELVRHWINATQPIDTAKAICYSRQAGDAALAALAPGDALRYYTHALDLHGRSDVADPILAIDLAIGIGTAQRQSGDPTFRDTLLDAAWRAADLGDTERLVAAALANSRGIFSAGGSIDADKIEVLEMARDRLATDDLDRALVLAMLCMELTFSRRLERLQALANEALTIAESVGDDATIVRVLNSVAYPLRVPWLLKQSLAWSADALVRAERVGDPALLFWAAWHRAGVAICAGDFGEMDRCLDVMGSLAEQLGQPTMNWVHTYAQALQAQIRGDNERTEQLATRALQIGMDSGQPDATIFYGAQYAAVSIQRGNTGGLIPLLQQSIAVSPELVARAPGLARCYVEADRIDEARRLLEEFAAVDFDLPLDPNWLQGTVNYAEVAIACQDPEYVGPLLDRLAPWADQIPAFGLTADRPVNAVLGGLATVLGRYHEADDYFARAAAVNDRARAKWSAASTNLSWATMLAKRNAPGDNDRARDLLTEAHTAAAANGYAGIERRAAEALRRLN